VQDVSLVASVPTAAVPALVAQAAAEQSRIAALQSALAARLLAEGTSVSTTTEKLLNIHEAADLLGLSVDWLYRRAKGLPFTRKVGRALPFDRVGLDAWVRARRRN
jgi:predicted DNA-binding transcriptional regulator AlpA